MRNGGRVYKGPNGFSFSYERVSGGANKRTRAFVGHGTMDEVVLPACGEESKKNLEAAGVPVLLSLLVLVFPSSTSTYLTAR